MIRNKPLLILSTAIFCTVEAVLGVWLQLASGRTVAVVCFSSIVLACLFCGVFFAKKASYLLTQLALLFTLCADYFLVLIPQRQQLVGMLLFSVAQLLYFLRLLLDDPNRTRRRVHLITRCALTAIVLLVTVMVLKKATDALALVSMFYYTNLVVNLIFAFAQFRRQGLMAIGFVLFLLCDTVIGLAFIDPYFTIPEGSIIHFLLHPGFDPAWACYLPSQVLLSISLLPERLKECRMIRL